MIGGFIDANTRQTAVWYMNNNVFVSRRVRTDCCSRMGIGGVRGLNRDGHPDYALFNPTIGRNSDLVFDRTNASTGGSESDRSLQAGNYMATARFKPRLELPGLCAYNSAPARLRFG